GTITVLPSIRAWVSSLTRPRPRAPGSGMRSLSSTISNGLFITLPLGLDEVEQLGQGGVLGVEHLDQVLRQRPGEDHEEHTRECGPDPECEPVALHLGFLAPVVVVVPDPQLPHGQLV